MENNNIPTPLFWSKLNACRQKSRYFVCPRKDHRDVDLISDALPFGGPRYTKVSDAVDYATFFSRSHDAVIRVYDYAGNVIETHQRAGNFKEW